ncbi:protein lingerer isoform X1 [Drosophila rhopaloa]|uniref:Protein lingerer n=1 Tax=Drosophila rhopaloa TaxID=1041015 RepID=A0ABM5GVK4_DRORH|nr:protein lingerer isoform X1 [Drosophila rhopaloa]XP_016970184.2 protein lingerer isoform X1 [Drosophila rhopaloa]
MSTQTRSGGGGGGGHTRNQKKSNASNSGGGGSGTGHHDGVSHAAAAGKKGGQDASKTDKPEKAQPKATTEQLRIAQITNSTTEDPQIKEKVTLLLTMTQRSEEEVCCALNECDYDLEAAANFLIEELPQGAFAKYEKKRKNKAASTAADGAAGDGDWADGNANADKREKSRNRSSNRGGTRGSTDSRGWRGRETRENERNQRESREPRSGGDRGEDRANDNYRGQRNGGGRSGPGGGGRGGGFVSRSGRGGGRMGGRTGGPRGDRGSGGPGGSYGSGRSGNTEDHHEVELWDNTIAQNAEKQQQAHDDAWGDWNNEEYEGSLKDSKVFTTSNLATQTAASVVSGTGASGTGASTVAGSELSAPPGLEHHVVQQGSHLEESSSSGPAVVTPPATLTGSATTPLLQYSAAVSNPPPQLQSQGTQSGAGTGASAAAGGGAGSTPTSFVSASPDTFSSAASAAATLVHQAQQQQQLQQQQTTPIKPSATLSVEQSQYFNSLASQGVSPGSAPGPPAPAGYAQNPTAAYSQTSTSVGVSQYPNTYANVFASGTGAGTGEQSQQQPQVRRARVKLPPPSKIPASAVEMPGDNALNNIGYLDVQFGALDFGTDDGFETLPEKVGSGFSIDGQQQQQQPDDYQSKSQQQQQQQATLAAGLQSSQISDALSAAGYTTRSTAQQQGVSSAVSATTALDQLAKSDPYGQTTGSGNAYQNAYQSGAGKATSGYPTTAPGGYSSSTYANVQSSVASSYQQQGYGSYQPNSYQQQAGTGAQGGSGAVAGGGGAATQNIPVGGSSSQNSTSGNASSAYLTSGYSTPQSAYQSSQSVYGNTGLSNSSGFAGSASNASSQYANFSTSAKLKDATSASSAAHYDSVSTSSGVSSSSGSTGNGGGVSGQAGANQAVVSNNNNVSGSSSVSNVTAGVPSGNVAGVGGGVSQSGVSSGVGVAGGSAASVGVNVNNNSSSNSSVGAAAGGQTATGTTAAVLASLTNKNSSSSNSSGSGGSVATTAGNAGGPGAGASTGGVGGASGAGGAGSGGGSSSNLVPTNIQMVSQYIQTGLPYYQQPVYSYEELQMMQQRVPHVQGYYDLNYPPASLGAGRENLGSVTYSAMNDGRFARTDNNSSPVGNVSSTMSQQAGSSAPMLNVPYAYFYGGNVMPGSFQYGTPAIYPQIPAANTASGQQFPKPSYSAGYGSTSYDTLSQTTQDYSKGGYSSSVNQQSKTQAVSNQSQAGTGSDLTSSMYGKGHVALNKVNSYEKQSFHSGTPPPFNMPNTQTAGGTSAQPYGMYLPMPAAGHHNMIHQPIHQVHSELALQVVVGGGAENHLLIRENGPQIAYQQIWQTSPVQCLDQDVASLDDNYEQNIESYVRDEVSGMSFFAD